VFLEPEELMRLAIDIAHKGVKAGQSPFGCAIVRDGQLIACRHNTVVAVPPDITAHAEVNALRTACEVTGQVHLTGAIVATTCEPCPMCMAALHWAQVSHVYYGATIADAASAGFNELQLSASELLSRGGSSVELTGGVLRDECRQLFADWLKDPQHRCY
jgi:tRNA(Arg) A34 adenosine deaminase TadA